MEISTTTAVMLFQAGFTFSIGMFLPMFFLLSASHFLSEPLRAIGEYLTDKFGKT